MFFWSLYVQADRPQLSILDIFVSLLLENKLHYEKTTNFYSNVLF